MFKNPPALEVAIIGLQLTLAALDELSGITTGGPCTCKPARTCDACHVGRLAEDADSMAYTVRLFRDCLDCVTVPSAAVVGRLAKALEDGKASYDPEQLAEALLRLAGEEDDESDTPLVIPGQFSR